MLPDDPRHGSYAGAKTHKRDGEPVCEPCRLGRNRYLLGLARASRQYSTRIKDRLEDLNWMADAGENSEGAARRLGIKAKSLESWCDRHDPNMWRRLRANDPVPMDSNNRLGHNQWDAA